MNLTEDEVKHYPEAWLELFNAKNRYWPQRFGEEAIEFFRLGYDYDSDAATIPLHDPQGNLLGVIRRDIETKRYRYPRNIKVSWLLYNYHRVLHGALDVLLVTEGATDTIAAWEVGYPAVAVFGSSMSERQAQLIARLNPGEVFFAFDQDDAGEKATEKAADVLKVPWSRMVWNPAYGKDLAAMSIETRRTVVKSLTQDLTGNDSEVVSTK